MPPLQPRKPSDLGGTAPPLMPVLPYKMLKGCTGHSGITKQNKISLQLSRCGAEQS